MSGREAFARLRGDPRGRWVVSGLILVVLVAVLARGAYEQMFSHANTPDDEGYLIITLRSFADGNALYDQVYSQYGPGFYTLVGGAMKLLGVAFTNDGARWVNLFLWLASTLLAGLALLRLTRSLLVSVVGLLVAFLVLSVDVFEPLHPGATVGFLLLALVAAAALLYPRRIPAAMVAIGALALALAAVKINVGGLALIAVAFACVTAGEALRRPLALRGAIVVAFVGVPFALMWGRLTDPDTLRFAVVVVAGALALALVCLRETPGRRPNRRDIAWLGAGIGAMLLVVSAVPIALGTSPGGLVDGWVIRPAGHAQTLFSALAVHGLAPVWALLGLAAAALFAARLAPGCELGGRARATLGAARVTYGLLVWLALAGPPLGLPQELTRALVIAPPFAWLAAIGTGAGSHERRFLVVLIPALAVLQPLHAFPVPGAQIAWGELLFVIVGGVCLAGGIADLAAAGAARRPTAARWRALGAALVIAFGAWLAIDRLKPFTDEGSAAYATSVPLGLPGAERLRVDPPRAEQLRELTAGIRRHCETFVSLPGLNSLYLYAEQPPPEELSTTWMLFLSDDEQRQVVRQLAAQRSLCAVRKPDVLRFWAEYHDDRIPAGPLVRFIRDRFEVLRNYQGYYLEVRSRAD